MPRDYKEPMSTRSEPTKKSISGLVFFIVGFISGAFSVVLLDSTTSPTEETELAQMGTSIVEEKPSAQKPQEKKPPKPTFEFYTELPSMNVPVIEQKIVPYIPKPAMIVQSVQPKPIQAIVNQPSPKIVKRKKDWYRLQMGAYQKIRDADRVKAELAFIGIHAEIQTVSHNNGQVFHRVITKPIEGKASVKILQNKLKINKIESFPIHL